MFTHDCTVTRRRFYESRNSRAHYVYNYSSVQICVFVYSAIIPYTTLCWPIPRVWYLNNQFRYNSDV